MATKKAPKKQAQKQASDPQTRDDKTGQFLPGKSGNPNGRPKKENCITDALMEELLKKQKLPRKDAAGRRIVVNSTYLRELVIATLRRAVANPDGPAAGRIWERVEGKVALPIETTEAVEVIIIPPPRPPRRVDPDA